MRNMLSSWRFCADVTLLIRRVASRTVIIGSDAGLCPPAAGVDVLPNKPMARSFPVGSTLLRGTAAFGLSDSSYSAVLKPVQTQWACTHALGRPNLRREGIAIPTVSRSRA